MPKFTRIFVLMLFLLPLALSAQTGKVVGSVKDLETGEALLGANIIIEGTSLGAASNENGEFIILNVPPGTYRLKARYIGYREVTLTNIRVSVNLTTEVSFALPSESYTTETITVVAPKPLINKNITNSTGIVSKEDIQNLPIRGVNALVSTQAGVVDQGGNLYIRGSRSDAVAYYVDGVLVNNPVFGGARSAPISNAIEEIQVQAGGYSAEYGGANGGIISTSTRGGSENYNVSAEIITDNFIEQGSGKTFLGTYSYGYSEYVLTAGGPVIPGMKNFRFFLAGNNVFQRTPAAYRRAYEFTDIPVRAGALRDTIDISYPANYVKNNANSSYQFSGNLTYDMLPFTFRLNGSYRYATARSGIGWTALANEANAGLNEDQTLTTSLKITHVINPNSFYDVIVNYFDDFYIDMDPVFKHDILAYGDSMANAAIGRDLQGDSRNIANWSAFAQSFTSSARPYNLYRKQSTKSYGGKLNFLYQLGKHHEFKTGGEFTYYTIRRYSIAPFAIAQNLGAIADGDVRGIYDRLDNYGYDVYGNALDVGYTGPDGPKNPVFAAFYLQDKMEFSDLVVNFGFRFDYIDVDSKTFIDPSNVQFDSDGVIDPDYMVDVDPFMQVSPRLGFSFPVTDRTVFHAQYGKFIQQSQLRNLYLGFNLASDIIKGGYAELNPVGYGLRPERTTAYEIGFRQQLGESFAFDLTGFYKDIKDQIQLRQIFADPTAQHVKYYALLNGDFSTVKGFEIKLDLRRTNRLSGTVDYTYSNAEGTGSTPNDAGRTVWQSPSAEPFFPVQIAPLSFNQTHRGAINLDYRYANNDGPEIFGAKALENFGLNVLFSFTSGFNYTRWDGFGNARVPNEALNTSTTPWTFQIDARLDKSFSVGPLNLNAYIWVINLLDTKNIVGVFNTSGDPVDDGWLASTEGGGILNGYTTEEDKQMYKDLYLASIYNSGNFGTPRQIRLGIRLDY